ncbi:MAG TPA: amylo-alpha-1,6-glucosidase, partial [Streptosporangiaceae bacterium]|nr:amylo-alpha-1,6-glucosidase [Streptosporangiaceae bacterium]
GLLTAASSFGWRLPELYAGEDRTRLPWPVPYPAACRPQAWAAAAAGALVQALLGLAVDVPAGTALVTPLTAGNEERPAGWPLHVDGLIAGEQAFSAGITAAGEGYLHGLSLP